jgi:S1-C subfamily serine protease
MGRAVGVLAIAVVALAALAAALGFKSGGRGVQQSALSLQDQFVSVVKRVAPAVVQIETSSGLGSGILFDTKGDIVTNYHVVGTAKTFRVTLGNGGKILTGKLVGTFREDDLAVIRVGGANVKPATFGSSSSLKVGDIVLAVGNPLGFQSSVTEGIVSALRGPINEGAETGATLPSTIQTSAAINPGNSGGALVGLDGKVVGIPTLAPVDQELGTPATGIGFAIPSDIVKDIAGQLVKYGKVVNSHRAYLGVQLGDTGSGALVGSVVAGTGAAKAGIRAGDLIVSIAGHQVHGVADVSTALATLKPGQTVKVGLVRQDGSRTTVTVTLGEYPGG